MPTRVTPDTMDAVRNPIRLDRAIGAIFAMALATLTACGPPSNTLTIATVNNGDMVEMKKLAPDFERQNPRIHLKWVVLEENVLRQRVTTDIAARAGQFDVVTIGNYEAPIWARQGWLKPAAPLAASYDVGDLLLPVRDAVSYKGVLYALPFYAESAMTYYRTDLFAAAGLTMPARPTYAQIADFAARLDDRAHQVYGVCLRGKPGWGENMATVTAIVHAFGGRWFAPGWRTTIDTPQWHEAVGYYSALLREHGPPGATSNGFNENLALFSSGHCAMWIDATVAASMLYRGGSKVAGKVGYAAMPTGDDPTAPTWLWSWNLAVPVSSRHAVAALKFISWATSPEYIRLVARTDGWIAAPPGTRRSTYDSPDYQKAAPFSGFVLNAIDTAIPAAPSATRPYAGAQFVGIPPYQGIGTRVGQTIAATLTGQTTVDAALKEAQASTEMAMRQAGYPKQP
jgi:sorbitol/mannitol transport system substrate-binding protein